jgi:hypothetical protein
VLSNFAYPRTALAAAAGSSLAKAACLTSPSPGVSSWAWNALSNGGFQRRRRAHVRDDWISPSFICRCFEIRRELRDVGEGSPWRSGSRRP